MRKILIPLVVLSTSFLIVLAAGCGGGGDPNPAIKDKAQTLQKKEPGGVKPGGN